MPAIHYAQTTTKKEMAKKWWTANACESITIYCSFFVWILTDFSCHTKSFNWYFMKKPLSEEISYETRNLEKLFHKQGDYDESCSVYYSCFVFCSWFHTFFMVIWAQWIASIRVEFSLYTINVFCHIQHCYTLLTHTCNTRVRELYFRFSWLKSFHSFLTSSTFFAV